MSLVGGIKIEIFKMYRDVTFFMMVVCAVLGVSESFLSLTSFIPWYKISFVFLIMFFLEVIFCCKKYNNNRIILFVSAISYMLVILFVNIFNDSQMVLKTIALIGGFLLMAIIDIYIPSALEIKFFFFIGIIGACILCFSFYNNAVHWYTSISYTIGKINPQSVGCWAFLYFSILLCTFAYYLKKKGFFSFLIKIFVLLLMAYLFWITIKTQTRVAMFGCVFVLLFHFFPMFSFIKKKWGCLLLSLMPMIVLIASIAMYYYGAGRSVLGNTLLNGREELWINYIKEYGEFFVCGNPLLKQNIYTHNLLLDFLISFGFIISFIFSFFAYNCMYKSAQLIQKKYQYDFWICFAICLLCSSVEGFFFTTGSGGMFIISFMFLLLSKNNAIRGGLNVLE